MNGQILTRINELEKEIKILKSLAKKPQKKSLLTGIWKGLKVSDKELDNAKKAPFDFDSAKHVR